MLLAPLGEGGGTALLGLSRNLVRGVRIRKEENDERREGEEKAYRVEARDLGENVEANGGVANQAAAREEDEGGTRRFLNCATGRVGVAAALVGELEDGEGGEDVMGELGLLGVLGFVHERVGEDGNGEGLLEALEGSCAGVGGLVLLGLQREAEDDLLVLERAKGRFHS